VKVCMFHLMPYRDLPADFERRYNSAYIDPMWFDVADSDKVGQYYNATLDEMLYAAKVGLHGLCTNQHHQNVYGFMANPSIMGAVLARQTNGQNVAIIQLGSTLPSTTPPTRIAEEYAMLDCISGGRLVAGFPTGLPADATISNAVIPVEQRERPVHVRARSNDHAAHAERRAARIDHRSDHGHGPRDGVLRLFRRGHGHADDQI